MPNSRAHSRQIRAPISIGELIDKITILEIKTERITDVGKLRNVAAELALLNELKTGAGLDTPQMQPHARALKSINQTLWDVEDALRELELARDFGTRFVELARSVYRNNDQRARVKQQINVEFGSEIMEEKSYKGE
jgi:hypothetical protein